MHEAPYTLNIRANQITWTKRRISLVDLTDCSSVSFALIKQPSLPTHPQNLLLHLSPRSPTHPFLNLIFKLPTQLPLRYPFSLVPILLPLHNLIHISRMTTLVRRNFRRDFRVRLIYTSYPQLQLLNPAMSPSTP